MVKIQVTDVNDNHPIFYPSEYNVSLREAPSTLSSSTPIIAVVATDPDSGTFGIVSYRIVDGNDAGIFRIDRLSGEIFIAKPNMLSSRSQPYHTLNVSATDGGGLKTFQNAEVFISVIDSKHRPPIFEKSRYNYYVKEDAVHGNVVGSVLATSSDSGNYLVINFYRKIFVLQTSTFNIINTFIVTKLIEQTKIYFTGSRGVVRYSINSGDPDGNFSIDPITGNIRVANLLDHETKSQILLNVQATSGDPPAYGHTQVIFHRKNFYLVDASEHNMDIVVDVRWYGIKCLTNCGLIEHFKDREVFVLF